MLKYKFPHEVIHLDGGKKHAAMCLLQSISNFWYKADLNCRKEGGLERGRKRNGMNNFLIGELLRVLHRRRHEEAT